MNTINQILKDENIDIKTIQECVEQKECNGCGQEKGFNFTDFAIETIPNLPNVDMDKTLKLIDDITILCNLHDIWYNKGGSIIDYVKANYKFTLYLIKLLHWTNVISRGIVFITVFVGTMYKGFRTFNFK